MQRIESRMTGSASNEDASTPIPGPRSSSRNRWLIMILMILQGVLLEYSYMIKNMVSNK